MKVGVGAIKGTFEGKVRLTDLEPPLRYHMAVEGKGGPVELAHRPHGGEDTVRVEVGRGHADRVDDDEPGIALDDAAANLP